ncbi:hypothetical protein N566_20210 [Streptomycetaceae bacterium MP113-05]|nr:hypothetical protein N566_20210 [Streptomycetaceae bacterium MP113-05]
MTQNSKLLALAIAGGYLLGRSKKGKLALAAASLVLGRRKGLNPQRLLTEGLRKLSGSPEFAQLNDQLRGELVTAGRSLVTAAANRRLDSLSSALHDRTDALSGIAGSDAEGSEDEEPEENEKPDEPDEPEEGEEPEAERRERRPARKQPTAKAPQKKAAAKKTPAGEPAARKAAAKKAAAKKTTSRTTTRRR